MGTFDEVLRMEISLRPVFDAAPRRIKTYGFESGLLGLVRLSRSRAVWATATAAVAVAVILMTNYLPSDESSRAGDVAQTRPTEGPVGVIGGSDELTATRSVGTPIRATTPPPAAATIPQPSETPGEMTEPTATSTARIEFAPTPDIGALSIETNAEWMVFSTDPRDDGAAALGPAQPVCASETSPPDCVDGATVYENNDVVWGSLNFEGANDGAIWIWAPDVSGDTAPADGAEYYFAYEFEVPKARVLPSSVEVLVDGSAVVWVNQEIVGTATLPRTKTTIDISPALQLGRNVILVRVSNGTNSCLDVCRYRDNPAGFTLRGLVRWLN